MKVQFGPKLVTVEPIEWTNKSRSGVIAFMVRCPSCKRNQWGRKADLYQAVDGTRNNFKCRHCGRGRPRRIFWNDPEERTVEFKHTLAPKCPGWTSLENHVYVPGPSAGHLDPLREHRDVQ